MKCGICKSYNVDLGHVRKCSTQAQTPRPAARPVRSPVTEEGIYFDGTLYYKVVRSEAGHLYAKIWDGLTWTYERGGVARIFAEQRVTADQAARFGRLTGACVFCGRRLTDERSVEVGYGPVCAAHNGLPWG